MLPRRTFITAAAATSILLPPNGSAAAISPSEFKTTDLEKFNLWGPVRNYQYLRPFYFDAKANGYLFRRLWSRYKSSNERWVAETALAVAYGWWRQEKTKAAKVKIARIGQQLAARVSELDADHPVGHL